MVRIVKSFSNLVSGLAHTFCFHLRSTSLFQRFFLSSSSCCFARIHKKRREEIEDEEETRSEGIKDEKEEKISPSLKFFSSLFLKRNKARRTDRSESSLVPHPPRTFPTTTNWSSATVESGIISKTMGRWGPFISERRKRNGEYERKNNNNLRCRMKIIRTLRRRKGGEEEDNVMSICRIFLMNNIFSLFSVLRRCYYAKSEEDLPSGTLEQVVVVVD